MIFPMVKAVSLSQVTFKYRNSDSLAIKNVSLDIDEGDFVLLVGYSGSGKSTLLKTINGLIPHFHAGSFGGDILIFDENVSESNTAQLAKKVGFVFQNPENQISALTVEREVAFPLENFGYPREEIITRVDELIKFMGLEEIRFKSPFSISGGEQQLTAIAAALALDPPILILDEVTAHLSPKSAQKILTKLSQLNKDYNKTIIISEHRLDRCIHFVSKMVYLEQGILKASGSVDEVLKNKSYPKNLLPAIPKIHFQFQDLVDGSKKKDTTPLTIEDFISSIKNMRGDS
ncbi:MAG: ABC transporter ATP-binding protein [Asgard group archaeon]|nr:ABC transporter ATP-binding protein [Asgard group archaeon]